LLAPGCHGTQSASAAAEHVKSSHIFLLGASVGVALMILCGSVAEAQTWDNSSLNAYIAAGYGDQNTAFAHGRYRTLSGEWLSYTNTSGKRVFPHGGLMTSYADETSTSYPDTRPVRGSLVSWSFGSYGHVGIIERPTFDSSGRLLKALVSEQNWKAGQVTTTELTASKLSKRGASGSYTLVGYLNPNRPPSIGSISTTKSGSDLQVRFPVLDEDGRLVRLLVALTDQNSKVLVSASGDVPANRYIRIGVSGLRSGSYRCYVWAWDFRGLRGTNSKSFTW
jgi:hypothetical protein